MQKHQSHFNFEPPVTDEEIRTALVQFVRKVSGFHNASKVNESAFLSLMEIIIFDRIKIDAGLQYPLTDDRI